MNNQPNNHKLPEYYPDLGLYLIVISILLAQLVVMLHLWFGWSWLAILGLGLAVILGFIQLIRKVCYPMLKIDLTDTEYHPMSDKAWDEHVKNHPDAWQYCPACQDRIVHVYNKKTRQWECMGCKVGGLAQ